MNTIYIARQKILNAHGKIFGYELLFRDSQDGIKEFPSNLRATAQILLTALTYMDFDSIIGTGQTAFVNIDNSIINSQILELLDPDIFVLELLETITIDEMLITNIKKLKKLGFTLALDDFICTKESLIYFAPIFKFLSVIKIDVMDSDPLELQDFAKKMSNKKITLLAEKIESKEDYLKYIQMGFKLFQGYYLHKPETIEYKIFKEATAVIVLKLITIIKNNGEKAEINKLLRKRPDLSFSLIQYINRNEKLDEEISSVIQVITLLGRAKLTRWLLMYLYAENNKSFINESLLEMAFNRAEHMESMANDVDKDTAFMTGMFSLLDILFDANFDDIFQRIKIDTVIVEAITKKKGKYGALLKEAENSQKGYLKKIFGENFSQFDVSDLIDFLRNYDIDMKMNLK